MNVGSSSESLPRAIVNFSISACVFGSTAIWTTGVGNVMFSSNIGLFSTARVSPVLISLKPTAAAMSPASILVSGVCLFAFICTILLILSLLPVVTLRTTCPASREPEYTLKNASLPTKGSVAILNASAHNGSFGSALRISSLSVFGFMPVTWSISRGLGR